MILVSRKRAPGATVLGLALIAALAACSPERNRAPLAPTSADATPAAASPDNNAASNTNSPSDPASSATGNTGSSSTGTSGTAPAGAGSSAPSAFTDERIPIANGRVYIPARYAPQGPGLDILIHLHGAPSFVERELDRAGLKAALVTINFNGLSSAYRVPFSDPLLLERILDEATIHIAAARGIPQPVINNLVLSSFSAGYAGIREVLNSGRYNTLIDDIVLSDSLHSGYVNGQPNPTQIAPFAAFARKAADGTQRRLIASHSSIVPPGYASTTETADALIAAAGAQRVQVDAVNSYGMRQTSYAIRGGFLVRGFSGQTAKDHSDHLQRIGDLWAESSLPR